MNTMRRGFTMIELIFVIVVIGILASVAIPKLAASRDDATAAICVHDYNQFIKELSGAYISSIDLDDWQTKTLADITNLKTGSVEHGIRYYAGTIVHNRWLAYQCDGETLAWVRPQIDATGNAYELYLWLDPQHLTSPALKQAHKTLTSQLGASTKKIKI